VLDDSSLALFAAQADGTLSRVDPESRVTDWSVPLARPACTPGDALDAAPVVHLRAGATAAFQAQYADDLVYAGTFHGCGGSANRVFALNAATGAVAWELNADELLVMRSVRGLTLDAATDRLFFTARDDSAYTPPETTIGAIDVLTGALLWSAEDLPTDGALVMRGDRVYAVTLFGEFKALDAGDGSEIWSLSTGSVFWRSGFDAGTLSGFGRHVIVAVDYFGNVWLAQDDGVGAHWLWDVPLPNGAGAAGPVVLDPVGGTIFVGADDGNVYQLAVGDGSLVATHVVGASSAGVGDIALYRPASAPGQIWVYAATVAGNVLRVVAASAAVAVPALGPGALAVLALGIVLAARRRRRAGLPAGPCPGGTLHERIEPRM
jgi:outer membrane protein assembly factor BamB